MINDKQIVDKKQLKIKEYKDQLGGVKKTYLDIEKDLNTNMGIYSLQKIMQVKRELKDNASQMRRLAGKLSKQGVIIDLEQR